ncbi:endonuclease/exonuclease/phosphatase family protein [Devosia rhodophyticola]|uniref:Endonuclease/exonuclease/phosphatase family protein n=1 Tax=Devosia rhodophyticola TaxID=3026423 RepID=A0ABY7YY02_9HYPH|nr:endonuclease/exonuclease/phosphatase family protein [Devosia rhodophyticola]WDR06097.1 endonuclease/exonuclease/phosphatase family protein [Devosia rhodophyticola]
MSLIAKLFRLGLLAGGLGAGLVAILAFFGFAVPAFDLFNHGQIFLLPATLVGLVVIAVLLRGRRRLVAVGIVGLGLVASGSILVPEYLAGARDRPAEPSDRPVITMMTHNLFGLNYKMKEVLAAILAEKPDIIVLQEYFGEQASDLDPLLKPTYPYSVRCRGGKRANIALYSKFKFEQVLDGNCPDNAYVTRRTAHITAKFTLADGTAFTVMTTHMDWPLPIARQREELDRLSAAVKLVEGPLVLAGDFNSAPWAYALRNFIDANGFTRQTLNLVTYPLRWFYLGAWRDTIPFLPLDQVLTRNGIVVHSLKAGQRTASDHLPVVFRFSVQPTTL